MYVDRSNAAHCNTHVFYKSTVCAYLMGMCVALQQCTCVVSSIRILSPTECIHSGLVHKHARSYMCVVSCTILLPPRECVSIHLGLVHNIRVQLDDNSTVSCRCVWMCRSGLGGLLKK